MFVCFAMLMLSKVFNVLQAKLTHLYTTGLLNLMHKICKFRHHKLPFTLSIGLTLDSEEVQEMPKAVTLPEGSSEGSKLLRGISCTADINVFVAKQLWSAKVDNIQCVATDPRRSMIGSSTFEDRTRIVDLRRSMCRSLIFVDRC